MQLDPLRIYLMLHQQLQKTPPDVRTPAIIFNTVCTQLGDETPTTDDSRVVATELNADVDCAIPLDKSNGAAVIALNS